MQLFVQHTNMLYAAISCRLLSILSHAEILRIVQVFLMLYGREHNECHRANFFHTNGTSLLCMY